MMIALFKARHQTLIRATDVTEHLAFALKHLLCLLYLTKKWFEESVYRD